MNNTIGHNVTVTTTKNKVNGTLTEVKKKRLVQHTLSFFTRIL